ncbi:MAG: tape measure protein [Hydrogenophaga sp.]|nr:tape measure protein [Hydrogenophaga sp.]
MATQNTRDVDLTLSVTTLGTESVKNLQGEINALAKEGGAAAPAFKALGDEIAQLGQQAELVTAARTLTSEIEGLSKAQTDAAQKTRDLRAQLAPLSAATSELAGKERDAKQALIDGQRALFDKKQALASLKNETSAADKESSKYTKQVRDLNTEIIAGKTAVRNLADEHRQAKAATKEASDAEGKFASKVTESATQLKGIEKALASRNDSLNKTKQALKDSGLATDNVAEAEGRLLKAYTGTVAAMDRVRIERDRAADAAKRAAAEEDRLAIIQMNRMRELQAAAKAEADGIVRDYARMEQAARESAQASKEAAKTLNDAFSTVGVKSVKDLQAEIERVRTALNTIKTTGTLVGGELDAAFRSGTARINELEREIRAATGQTTLMDRAAVGLKSTFGQFAAGFTAVEVVQRLGRSFIDANVGLERLRLGLKTIYKDSNLAATQIDFLRKSANAAGIGFGAITDSFVKFVASTQSANISMEVTNDLFASVTRAAGTLGLSGDKVTHILDALSQMAGKGVVSMEELRQQLGDSLPGALSLTAKGLGLTDTELIKLVESGGLLARDLFPALTQSLKQLGAEVFTVQSTWERLKNVMTQVFSDAGDTGVWEGLKYVLATVGVTVNALANGFGFLFDGVVTGSRQMVAALTLNFSEVDRLGQAFIERQTEQGRKLRENAALLYGLSEAQGVANAATAAAVPAAAAAANAQAGVATAAASSAAALTSVAGAATQAAAGQVAAGQAATAAGQAVQAATGTWEQLNIAYKDNQKSAAQSILNAERLARAKEIEGQTMVTLAQITGNESKLLDANAAAKRGQLAAMAEVERQRALEISQMESTIAGLEREAKALGDPDRSRAKAIQAIRDNVVARQAESEKTKQTVKDLEMEVLAREIAVKTNRDNSASLDKLRDAFNKAREAEQWAAESARLGLIPREAAKKAADNAAAAEAMYRDALNDSAAASQRATQATRDRATVAAAGLQVDMARSRASEALARAMGNETAVTIEQVAQKRIEIQTVRAAIEAKKAEAAEIIRLAELQRANLDLADPQYAAKKAEIDSRIANARAMQLEAGAMGESIKLLELEIQTLQRNTQERERNNASKGGSAPGTTPSSKYAKPKGGSVTGNTREERLAGQNAVDNTLMFALRDKLNAGTLSAADADQIRAVIAALDQNEQVNRDLDRMNPGAFSLTGAADRNEWRNVRARLDQALSEMRGGSTGGGGAIGQPRTVNVNIGGSKSTVTTASDADADALVAMLKSLESASTRTF